MPPAARPILAGRVYKVRMGRRDVRVKVLRYDPVDKTHVVAHRGKETRLDFRTASRVSRVVRPKTDTSTVHLYLCDIGGGCYKLGASSDVERRRKQIRTCAAKAEMRAVVPLRDGARFRACEKAVLGAFAVDRGGGTEVLRLDGAQDVRRCVAAMRQAAVHA